MNTHENMTRLRWGLAACLAVVAFIAAGQSMSTYRAHGMSVGLFAVIALAILLVVGLVSLGRARVRIGRELAGLRSPSGSGVLWSARHKRLAEVKAAGARPDVEALAEVTRAGEAGHAYIGRYLVATTVLLGLVGTFGGLMQALGKLAPLFGDDDKGGLALLAAPLAGLHVTFGASLVAILATLALVIAQGDLALCEDQALAILEDRTTHELIPALWPVTEDAGERTVRAVDDLKAVFADALTKSIDASLKRMSENARGDSDRASRAVETIGNTVQQELARLCTTVSVSLEQSVRRQEEALVAVAERQAEALTESTTRVTKQVSDVAGGVMTGLREEVQRVIAAATDAGAQSLRAAGEASRDALGRATAATEAAVARSVEIADAAVSRSTAATEAALARSTAVTEEATRRSLQAAEQAGQRGEAAVAELVRVTSDLIQGSAERGVGAIRETMGASAAAMRTASETSSSAIAEVARSSVSALKEATERAAERQEQALQRSAALADTLLRGTADAVEKSTQATAASVARTLEPLLAGEGARLEELRAGVAAAVEGVQAAVERIAELTASLDGVAKDQVAAMDRNGQAVLAAFDRAVIGGGKALEIAAGSLATAARDLHAGADTLGPRLAALATELGSLGREVALLMAARGPEGDLGAVVLGELDRVGAGVDRLAALLKLADGESVTAGAPSSVSAMDATAEPSVDSSVGASAGAPAADSGGVVAEALSRSAGSAANEVEEASEGVASPDDVRDGLEDGGDEPGLEGEVGLAADGAQSAEGAERAEEDSSAPASGAGADADATFASGDADNNVARASVEHPDGKDDAQS